MHPGRAPLQADAPKTKFLLSVITKNQGNMLKRLCHLMLMIGSIATSAGRTLGGEAIKLTSPLVRQVFQRDAQEQGSVRIEGQVPAATTKIEVRAELDPEATRGHAMEWTVVARDKQIVGGAFAVTLTLKTGGWYQLRVRACDRDRVMAEAVVEKVGVGEVFITAGQSNSANAGEPPQNAQDDRVVYFNGRTFVEAKDPIPGSFGEGGSPWPILGDLLVRTTQAPVCFRSVSLHWARAEAWRPDAQQKEWPYYTTMIERTRWFGLHGVRGVLWHQGEDDASAGTSAEQYAQDLGAVIQSMRQDLGYRIDWFVAAASYSEHGSRAREAEVVRGQKLLWTRGIALRGPDTNDLGPKYRARDGGHFGPLGLRTHAERWYASLCSQYNLANPVSCPPTSTVASELNH